MLKIQEVTHLQEFTINFGRLKLGKHEFQFDLDGAFFEHFETELIKTCSTRTKLIIEKTRANLMTFDFEISGEADFECDRCTDVLAYPIEGAFSILVKLEEQEQVDTDEIIYLPTDAYEFNIAELIYDFHILSIPFKKDCVRENHPTCIRIDQIINGNSFNEDDDDSDSDEEDPRWSELKKLL